jgi:Fe-S cluster assembly scaffold protein SufB
MLSRLLIIVLACSIVQTALAMKFLRVTSKEDMIVLDMSDKVPRPSTVKRVVLDQDDVFSALHKEEHGPELVKLFNRITDKNAKSVTHTYIVADKDAKSPETWSGMGSMGTYESVSPELAQVLHSTIKKVSAKKEKQKKIRLAIEQKELRLQEKRLAFLRITSKDDYIILDSTDKEPRPSTVNRVVLNQEEVFSVLQKEKHGPEAIQILNYITDKNARQLSPSFIVADKKFQSAETWTGMGRLGTYEMVTPEFAKVLHDAVKKVIVQKETEKKFKLAKEEEKLRQLELARKEEEEIEKRSAAGFQESPADIPAGKPPLTQTEAA